MAVVTKTLKSSGGDYSLMSTWESTEQTDLVSDGDIHVLECDAFTCDEGTTQVTVAGWTTGAANTVTITNAPGVTSGVVGEGFKLLNADTFAYALKTELDYITVRGITIDNNVTTNSSGALYLYGDHALVDSCILYGSTGTTNTRTLYLQGVSTTNAVSARNCLVFRSGVSGIELQTYAQGPVYNCTVDVSGTYGITKPASGNAVVVRNCVALNASVSDMYIAGTKTVTNCATGDGTEGSITITSADFKDYANDDYQPTSDGALADAGTDLSADFLDDITGTAR